MVEIVLGIALFSAIGTALVASVIVGGITYLAIREWVRYRRESE